MYATSSMRPFARWRRTPVAGDQGHKKEIREREETIADKEKRIYDLKKKNQEVLALQPCTQAFISL